MKWMVPAAVRSLTAFFSLSAYCKNSVDGLWYCFDDADVQQLAENEVCKQTAYILFYQRRATIPSWSANSSVAGKATLAASRDLHGLFL